MEQGISDAFRDGELLAGGVDAGFSGREPLMAALAGYQHRHDEQVGPMFATTEPFARMDAPAPEMVGICGSLHGNQERTDRLFGTFAGTVPIPEFFAPENLERIMSAQVAIADQGSRSGCRGTPR